ncbi:hypothetical protein ABW19_dt0206586 [Dactylella cylindrospora]|nr:hypothetical protein ABW19_dt0206586 [Dactylella cylindrospora]
MGTDKDVEVERAVYSPLRRVPMNRGRYIRRTKKHYGITSNMFDSPINLGSGERKGGWIWRRRRTVWSPCQSSQQLVTEIRFLKPYSTAPAWPLASRKKNGSLTRMKGVTHQR